MYPQDGTDPIKAKIKSMIKTVPILFLLLLREGQTTPKRRNCRLTLKLDRRSGALWIIPIQTAEGKAAQAKRPRLSFFMLKAPARRDRHNKRF
jgi:hypothetical protein